MSSLNRAVCSFLSLQTKLNKGICSEGGNLFCSIFLGVFSGICGNLELFFQTEWKLGSGDILKLSSTYYHFNCAAMLCMMEKMCGNYLLPT